MIEHVSRAKVNSEMRLSALDIKFGEHSVDYGTFHDPRVSAEVPPMSVQRYELVDHAPPEITQIQQFCDDVHHWLNEDPKNVAAVHCKAGKGRTGTMVCCYLLYCGQKESADMALQFYGHKRTHDKKGDLFLYPSVENIKKLVH
ncbi:jg17392 [Pararge aegeria aegeria]|uniref:Jg17392 protein n=1 Tax=Pararge aegeria aegeria TaxID=348720 RepID=A0A8S4RWT0_9NEOP|nr:jg17392 [Pararge aegeria aegeria]